MNSAIAPPSTPYVLFRLEKCWKYKPSRYESPIQPPTAKIAPTKVCRNLCFTLGPMKYSSSIARTVKPTDTPQRRCGQTITNCGPRSTLLASQLPKLGPTINTDSAITIRTPITKVIRKASDRVFQSGLVSGTSQATFNPSIREAQPLGADQSVPIKPPVRKF